MFLCRQVTRDSLLGEQLLSSKPVGRYQDSGNLLNQSVALELGDSVKTRKSFSELGDCSRVFRGGHLTCWQAIHN